MSRLVILGLAGLALVAFVPPPDGLSPEVWRAAGLALVMALWWLTEALPLAATALVPLVAGPALGLGALETLAPAYAHPLIFLFLGGFVLARGLERWELHSRLAQGLLARAGRAPGRVLAALMATAAFLSLWISNTASAMVMAPIAAAIAAKASPRVAATLMLGVAYGATIGGMGSLIGTPPNAIFAAYLAESRGITVGFAEWAMVGVPVAASLLALAWAWLRFASPGLGAAGPLDIPARAAGPLPPGARRVAVVAGLAALAWITRPWLDGLAPGLALSDAGIALAAALLLFLLPSGEAGGGRLLDWADAAGLRWDVLILFGGGLALAGIIETSGLAAVIGGATGGLAGLPVLALLLLLALVIVMFGELASNTAMAAIFMPIAGAAALRLGLDPVAFLMPVALVASVGFMLPVATPPNAIVFAHPAVERQQMMRTGAGLDLVAIVLIVGLVTLIGPSFG